VSEVRSRLALRLLACMALAGCATSPPAPHASFVVVRHAEKAGAGRDPGLAAEGQARALALAELLAKKDLVATYATDFRRTRDTVQPAAAAHGLAVTTYDASEAPTSFAARLHAAHPRGTVLVAGHSNTVPGIVSALCDCESTPMGEQEYDRISIVSIGAQGARLSVARYGKPSPES